MKSVVIPGVARLLLTRFTLRHWRQSPLQTLLLILLLSLGIGVFFAMRLANRAVLARFEGFTSLVQQESDLTIVSPAGSLQESTLPEIRQLLGSRPVQLLPVLEVTGAEPARAGEERTFGTGRIYTILGVDLAALTNLTVPTDQQPHRRDWLGLEQQQLWDVLKQRRDAYISATLAEKLGLQVGSRLPVLINDRVEDLRVAGVVPHSTQGVEPPETMIVLDLPALQELAGLEGRIERIECLVELGSQAASIRRETREILQKAAGERWQVVLPDDRRESAAQLTRALRLNLTLLSTLALVVGFYFIYQALDGAVVRRREEIATLRSLGITVRHIRLAWLLEAVLLGFLGGALGGLLGWVGAQGAVRLVSRSVNALYQTNQVSYAPFSWGEFAFALALGVASSAVAGWLPAKTAAATPPAQVLRRHSGTTLAAFRGWLPPTLTLLAVVATLCPPLRTAGGAAIPLGGYLATLCSVLAISSCMGFALTGIAKMLRGHAVEFLPLRLALSQLRRPSVRHVIASACLLAAVAMTGGMAILVGSYDTTMKRWLGRTFLSDLYISSQGAQSASSTNRIRPETWKAIVSRPTVLDFYGVQMSPVTIDGKTTLLAGADFGFIGRRIDMGWMHEPPPTIYSPETNLHLAAASEAFTMRFGVGVGDRITFPTPSGSMSVTLAGVFADYGNERGTLMIDRVHFAKAWGSEGLSAMTLKLKDGVDPLGERSEIRNGFPSLTVYTNKTLREQALRVFEETFSVTYALEVIGVVVAVAGLGLTLASIFMERRSELATLRSLAWSPREIASSAAWEGVLLSVAGLVGGIILSLILGLLLVYVINRQSFGWTLEYHIPWQAILLLSALVLGTGSVTSYFVGRWAARLRGVREE